MSEEKEEAQSEVAATWGDKSIRAKSKYLAEWITIFLLVLWTLNAYVMWDHLTDTKAALQASAEQRKENVKMFTEAIKGLDVSMKAHTSAQREMNCLIAMPQDKRETEYRGENSFCRRISRD